MFKKKKEKKTLLSNYQSILLLQSQDPHPEGLP